MTPSGEWVNNREVIHAYGAYKLNVQAALEPQLVRWIDDQAESCNMSRTAFACCLFEILRAGVERGMLVVPDTSPAVPNVHCNFRVEMELAQWLRGQSQFNSVSPTAFYREALSLLREECVTGRLNVSAAAAVANTWWRSGLFCGNDKSKLVAAAFGEGRFHSRGKE